MTPDDPRMADVDCGIAQFQYREGQNGIQIAEGWLTQLVDVLLVVRAARATNSAAYPGFGQATPEETARRAVARLLDAGWRPPDAECLELDAGSAAGGGES